MVLIGLLNLRSVIVGSYLAKTQEPFSLQMKSRIFIGIAGFGGAPYSVWLRHRGNSIIRIGEFLDGETTCRTPGVKSCFVNRRQGFVIKIGAVAKAIGNMRNQVLLIIRVKIN